jgi:hypothetical protein
MRKINRNKGEEIRTFLLAQQEKNIEAFQVEPYEFPIFHTKNQK